MLIFFSILFIQPGLTLTLALTLTLTLNSLWTLQPVSLLHSIEVRNRPKPQAADPRLRPMPPPSPPSHPTPTSLGFSRFRGFHRWFDMCWVRSMGNCYCCCCVQCVVGSSWWNGCVLGVDLGRSGVFGCWEWLIWSCVWLLGKCGMRILNVCKWEFPFSWGTRIELPGDPFFWGTRIELLGDQIIVGCNEWRLICVSNWVSVIVWNVWLVKYS